MSFSVYLQWYEGGEASGVPASAVRGRFGEAVEEEDWGWQLDYGATGSPDVYLHASDDDASSLTGITVDRPCIAAGLWSALYDLLTLGNGVFYFPGSRPYVARVESSAHLPGALVEAIGQPEVVTKGSELLTAIEELE